MTMKQSLLAALLSLQLSAGQLAGTQPGSEEGICSAVLPPRSEWRYGFYDSSGWRYWQTPLQDPLDRYMINKTGCAYLAGGINNELKEFWRGAREEGKPLQLRLMLRTATVDQWGDGDARLALQWGDQLYWFWLFNFSGCTLWQHRPDYKKIATANTPRDMFADDRYTPFVVTLDGERLSLHKSCEPSALFSTPAALPAGTELKVSFMTLGTSGAKLLHSCPKL